MKARRIVTIRSKLVLTLILGLTVVFGSTGTLVGFRVFEHTKETARLYMESLSREYANKTDALLEIPMDTARALARAFEGYESLPAAGAALLPTSFGRTADSPWRSVEAGKSFDSIRSSVKVRELSHRTTESIASVEETIGRFKVL
jgi:hypothetical protein